MSRSPDRTCPDCDAASTPAVKGVNRREFLARTGAVAGIAALSTMALPRVITAAEPAPAAASGAESIVKKLYDSFNEKQRSSLCFEWDHQDKDRGLLRTRVANNWHITEPQINSDFFTKDQQGWVREIFENLIQKDWHAKIDKQLEDDAGGFGEDQNIAIFGKPGDGKFEFVMTGRHMTLRCDGNSADHVAFGGPIFYGHAASGFNEMAGHPNNVFWPQAVAANEVYKMLDGKQRDKALVANTPREQDAGFQGEKGTFPGLAVSDMTSDQKEVVQKALQKLIEPYRQADRDEVLAALKTQGGLDKCSLAFFKDSDFDKDGVWDNWRLEGPAFVWHFRGNPHVHVWVNVASSPDVKLNA
jgi:hypothetical protein